MSDPWRVSLFGGLRAQQGEKVITRFKTQRVASLFAYLAYYPRQAHAREVLIEMLWPESDAQTLRNSLSVALSTLRNQFEPPGVPQGTIIRADRFSVGLNPATVTTDVAEFEQALKAAAKADSSLERAQYLASAVELYQGQLLPGFYEDWIPAEHGRLSGQFFDAVVALVGHLDSVGDTRLALSHIRHAVAVDPLREEGQQLLIRLLVADGQPGAALRQYKEYERLLEQEIGEEPSSTLRDLYRDIEKSTGLSGPTIEVRRHAPAEAATEPGEVATLTFLATDIEGSAALSSKSSDAFSAARSLHHQILRNELELHSGQLIRESEDGFVASFPSAGTALNCAVAVQRTLAVASWPEAIGSLPVRLALHTGDVHRSTDVGANLGGVFQFANRLLAAAHGGQILISDATAALARGALKEGVRLVDLGAYRLRDVADAKRVYQVEYPDMPRQDFGPLSAESGHKANVPPRFTRFFGREDEMERLREMLLTPDVRLVTLTGPGGNGKTRLSQEVAERLAEPFSGAVYFVALQDLTDPSLIPDAILDSMSVAQSSVKDPLEQAIVALADKPTLLVLDNVEHLIDGGAEIVQTLLNAVPALKLLITSRQVLGLPAEHEFTLSPLPIPDVNESPEQLSLYDSVQLFIDRAQQVIPYFQVSNANAAAVAALVGGLEGIPLAIELAATRVQVLSPAEMLSQLSNRLDFLSSRKRGISERQRTLRGALDWSYRLLTPEVQRFFYRLSVFRGGWTVAAAEQVCEEPLALDYLEHLRECSLVQHLQIHKDEVRFGMLETLREYGLERLTECKETEPMQLRHLGYFLTLAEAIAPRLYEQEQGEWLSRLEDEHDNLRAALDKCSTDDGAAGVQLRLCGALWRFWYARGHVSEGRSRCVEALGKTQEAEWSSVRAKVLNGVGSLTWLQCDYGAAAAFLEESLTLYQDARDTEGMARSLSILGNVEHDRGNYAAARELQEQSLAIEREKGRTRMAATSLCNLGEVLSEQGDFTSARAMCDEGLSIFRELGDRMAIGLVLVVLGADARCQGDYTSARSLLEESIETQREIGNRWGLAVAMSELARVACEQGDYASANAFLIESLPILRAFGDRRIIAATIEGLADVASAVGTLDTAARMWGAAERVREEIGSPMLQRDRPRYRQRVSESRVALGDDAAFDSAWEAGRSMTVEQAVEFALQGEGERPS